MTALDQAFIKAYLRATRPIATLPSADLTVWREPAGTRPAARKESRRGEAIRQKFRCRSTGDSRRREIA